MNFNKYLSICSKRFDFYYGIKNINHKQEYVDYENISILNEKEKEIYFSFKINKRKVDWLAGRIATKKAFLNFYNNFSVNEITILNREDRSPYIVEFPSIYVTISHTEDIAIALISTNKLGVDIEKISPINMAISKYFFSKNELDKIQNMLSNEEKLKLLYKYWTRKEAIAKYLKLGMNLNFKFIDTISDKYSTPLEPNKKIALISKKINNYYFTLAI